MKVHQQYFLWMMVELISEREKKENLFEALRIWPATPNKMTNVTTIYVSGCACGCKSSAYDSRIFVIPPRLADPPNPHLMTRKSGSLDSSPGVVERRRYPRKILKPYTMRCSLRAHYQRR
ncbi:hypothetical protein CEXT_434641 [Caerostris extrusa]|uniref:Uncharacterized protein n=1 Tax=Caerostris extrusa TaxID=172846 RepID=A0AAV4XBB0_CAEEX|nr:hypothetical protein CEXT_434641 [Caerostris extrusa]